MNRGQGVRGVGGRDVQVNRRSRGSDMPTLHPRMRAAVQLRPGTRRVRQTSWTVIRTPTARMRQAKLRTVQGAAGGRLQGGQIRARITTRDGRDGIEARLIREIGAM